MPECEWVNRGETENGHVWERAYHNHRLVAIRCSHCGEQPINVMREDFSVEPCRGVFAGGKVVPRPGEARDPV